MRDALAPGGSVVIWEPAWPADITQLRSPRLRGMAFQNLSEHVQGNHFLQLDEIAHALVRAGFRAHVQRFAEGAEAVIVGTR